MIPEKKVFISDIKEGQFVESTFLVVNKELRPRKNEGKYLRIILADKTGEIVCNMWDNFEKIFPKFQIDDYVAVRGSAKLYQKRMQLSIKEMKKVPHSEIDIKNYQKSSEYEPEEMWKELQDIIQSIEDTHLKKLLLNIFTREEIKHLFINAPAAKALHHSYNGGLIEHTLSLAGLCELIVQHFNKLPLNRDLLITGALLHDIGKIYELTFDRSYNYTDEGRLLGHITIEAIMIEKEIEKIDGFSEELRLQLLHIVLSHHGNYEFGSPKRPKTLEALILYYLDDLDAKVESMLKFITENAADGKWAGFETKQFERFIYKGSLLDTNGSEKND